MIMSSRGPTAVIARPTNGDIAAKSKPSGKMSKPAVNAENFVTVCK